MRLLAMEQLIGIFLFALAAAAFVLAAFLRRKARILPAGQLVYSDVDRRSITEPITSRRLRLTRKPDYVYSTGSLTIPLEMKQYRAGRCGPRDRDVIQLLTCCVLVEDVWGATVTHGLLEYSDRRFTIPYGPEQRRQVLESAEAIRRDRIAADVPRDHHDAWKCGRCGYSETCSQALVGR